jgi:uncharacterized membrane protein
MDLALIAFDGVNAAEDAFATACDRPGAHRWEGQLGFVEHHEDGHLVLRGTFAGRYVDVDEAQHVSEVGAAKGWGIGAAVGLLLGPPAFAAGSVLGAVIGSQEAEPTESDREPTLVADRLRTSVPAPGSAVVLVAQAEDVDEMLRAFELDDAHVIRRTLSSEELAALNVSLSVAPPASPR